MKRRAFLTATALSIPTTLSGCTAPTSTPTDTPKDPNTDELNVENPNPVTRQEFENWEPDTNCNNGEMEAMYNSEISVTEIKDELSDDYNPIDYTQLPQEEKEILAEVLELGGYDTCETSDAFNAFLERAVYEHAREQDGDDMHAYLEYDNTYYQLYIRKQDQVYAY